MAAPHSRSRSANSIGRICRVARRCCERRVRKSAAPTCICGTGGSPACRIRSSRPRLGRHAGSPIRGALTGLDGTRFAKAIASSSSTSIARAAGAAPAPSTARRRDAARGASTASPTRRAKGSSAAGRRRSISSPAWDRAAARRVTFDDYIGGGCGLLTAVHIVERAALRAGDTVLVQGTGAVGLSTIALARWPAPRRSSPLARPPRGWSSRATWAPIMCSISTGPASRTGSTPYAR